MQMRRSVGERKDPVTTPDCAGHRSRPAATSSGFTMIELVVVMIIVAILAVVAIPRLNVGVFNALGFYDETQSAIRFAQKDAIAKRRNVCITFTSNSVTLKYSPTQALPAACSGDLTSPRGTSPFVITAASGISFSPVPGAFSFDGLGRPSIGQTINVIGDGTKSFTVETETGYVHP